MEELVSTRQPASRSWASAGSSMRDNRYAPTSASRAELMAWNC
jgi:hypothetical protein